MGFLKTAFIGAAVYAGVKYITKKDPLNGKSIMDDLIEKAPEWMEKAKGYKKDIQGKLTAAQDDLDQ